mgnify:CR=1 FL=1
MSDSPKFVSTTVLAVRKNGKTAMAGDGQVTMNAYVTSKIIPGTVAMHFGAWYMPNEIKTELMPYGMDTRGACNFLIGDVHLPHVVNSILTAGLVEVKKSGGNE